MSAFLIKADKGGGFSTSAYDLRRPRFRGSRRLIILSRLSNVTLRALCSWLAASAIHRLVDVSSAFGDKLHADLAGILRQRRPTIRDEPTCPCQDLAGHHRENDIRSTRGMDEVCLCSLGHHRLGMEGVEPN